MPLDYQKILTDYQPEVTRLFDFAKRHLKKCKPNNNYYLAYSNDSGKLKINFRKVYENGKLIGYRHAEVDISPHYHKNNYQHNADILTPIQAIESLYELLSYLEISQEKYNLYKVVVCEFGFNIITDVDPTNIIDKISFYQRSTFNTQRTKNKYFKISNTDKTKEWKIYHKGLQYPEINPNTLRIELRLKKARTITAKTGIRHIGDLLKIDTFNKLFENYINDFDNIFFCEDYEYFLNLKTNIKETTNRNKWGTEKGKYLKNKPHLTRLKSKTKGQIIDTFLSFQKSAISPQKTTINKGKLKIENNSLNKINGENALSKVCKVTHLNISMQKKTSKYLCFSGLRFYYQNEPKIFQKLAQEFLTEDKRTADLQTQFYYLAHNIRNQKTNLVHNRKNFEQRNYKENQLRFEF